MRFVSAMTITGLVSLLLSYGAGDLPTGQAYARPGDLYGPTHKTLPVKSQTVRSANAMTLTTLDGHHVSPINARLSAIKALAMSGSDVWVMSPDSGEIIKLHDRNGDGEFETQAPYLIGINGAQDMLIDGGQLYILDQYGVWRGGVEKTMSANKAPTLISRVPGLTQNGVAATMAIARNTGSLYVSTGPAAMSGSGAGEARLYEYDLKSGELRTQYRFDFHILDLATTPSGRLIAATFKDGVTRIGLLNPTNTSAPSPGGFALPFDQGRNSAPLASPMVSVRILIPTLGESTQDGPQAINAKIQQRKTRAQRLSENTLSSSPWQDRLVVALGGSYPLIGAIDFQYGDLAPTLQTVVEGFAKPSARIGYTQVYAEPTAMTISPYGQMIIGDTQGQLWAVRPGSTQPTKVVPKPRSKPDDKKPTPKPDPFRSFKDAIFNDEYDASTPDAPKTSKDVKSGDKDTTEAPD